MLEFINTVEKSSDNFVSLWDLLPRIQSKAARNIKNDNLRNELRSIIISN